MVKMMIGGDGLQVSNTEQALYIGKRHFEKLNDDNEKVVYYFVTVCDETGETMTLFTNRDVYEECSMLSLAMPVVITLDIQGRRQGVGCSITGIRPA